MYHEVNIPQKGTHTPIRPVTHRSGSLLVLHRNTRTVRSNNTLECIPEIHYKAHTQTHTHTHTVHTRYTLLHTHAPMDRRMNSAQIMKLCNNAPGNRAYFSSFPYTGTKGLCRSSALGLMPQKPCLRAIESKHNSFDLNVYISKDIGAP